MNELLGTKGMILNIRIHTAALLGRKNGME